MPTSCILNTVFFAESLTLSFKKRGKKERKRKVNKQMKTQTKLQIIQGRNILDYH